MALSYETIQAALDGYLDPVLSTRRTSAEPARGLMPLPREQQEFALHWTDVVRRSNTEMAYQFVIRAPLALKLMGMEGAREWLLRAMDIYDKLGLYPGSAALDEVEQFARGYRLNHVTVTLDQVRGVLETILRGLSGRNLKLEVGNSIYTDTETLYLPAAINRFDDRERNYRLYKVMAVHLWAQTWFGTFRRSHLDAPHLCETLADYPDAARALKLFSLLETARLNACIQRHLPGLGRDMLALDEAPENLDATWQSTFEQLHAPGASVEDTLRATRRLYDLQSPWPRPFAYQGGLNLDAAQITMDQRAQREAEQLRGGLRELLESMLAETGGEAQAPDLDGMELGWTRDDNGAPRMTVDGEALATPPDMQELLSSLLQDFDDLPDEWLVPGDADGGGQTGEGDGPGESRHAEGDAFTYDEWDFRRQTYRKNWCRLRELPAHACHDDFTEKTLERYAPLVREIRKHFEALRQEDRTMHAQPGGDDIDLDALVTARADALTGVEMSDRLYTHKQKQDRDLAVMFMVDVSGSTKGWINDAERESLVLLCQALEILRDQYAIYGFSGMTRNRCEVYRIKDFTDPYDADTRARISGIRPQNYTRMGVVIRHLSKLLNAVEARTRILITLSDGKPDDYDGYRGEHGIEDTRQALLEARHLGIHPFCITIDTEAGDYLPHMYGHASFVVVDEVRKLPLKVADIYRRLTT